MIWGLRADRVSTSLPFEMSWNKYYPECIKLVHMWKSSAATHQRVMHQIRAYEQGYMANTHTHTFSHVLINTSTSFAHTYMRHTWHVSWTPPAASYQLSANPPLAGVLWPTCLHSGRINFQSGVRALKHLWNYNYTQKDFRITWLSITTRVYVFFAWLFWTDFHLISLCVPSS